MATISKGIRLLYALDNENEPIELTNLQSIPDLGGEKESIEITTLADEAHKYTDGILNYGDSLAFKFLYEREQFNTLSTLDSEPKYWIVSLPDGMRFNFNGTCSVKLDGVGVNAALTYTLSIKPTSKITWDNLE